MYMSQYLCGDITLQLELSIHVCLMGSPWGLGLNFNIVISYSLLFVLR